MMDYIRNSKGPVEKALQDSGIDKRNMHKGVLVGGLHSHSEGTGDDHGVPQR